MNRLRYALTIFMLLMCPTLSLAVSKGDELTASAMRISGDSNKTTVEIDFDGVPLIDPRLMSAPNRVILDLPQAFFALGKFDTPKNSLVASVRAGLIQEGRSRVVIALNGPVSFEGPVIKPSADGRTHIFSFELTKSDEAKFKKTIQEQSIGTASIAGGKGDRVFQPNTQKDKAFILVIDPGHGGIDGGATGRFGVIEKEITLQFAKELQAKLAQNTAIKVFLTRTDDRFIALDERVKIARQLSADLFISIHADTIADNSLRGATIYTLSDKASDEVSRVVAQQENLSDAIGGVETVIEDQSVADILIDLTRRETIQHSVGFARATVEALKKRTKLIHNPHRSAGFRVLRAADVPSILVELGYLSNVEDEKQIKDAAWRQGVVEEMARTIGEHGALWMSSRQ